jgi:hypothetical protein
LIERLLMSIPADIGRLPANAETGPGHFTRRLLADGFDGDLTLFPSTWFYPYRSGEPRATALSHPDAFAAHHWAHSWQTPRSKHLLARVKNRLRRWMRSSAARAWAS